MTETKEVEPKEDFGVTLHSEELGILSVRNSTSQVERDIMYKQQRHVAGRTSQVDPRLGNYDTKMSEKLSSVQNNNHVVNHSSTPDSNHIQVVLSTQKPTSNKVEKHLSSTELLLNTCNDTFTIPEKRIVSNNVISLNPVLGGSRASSYASRNSLQSLESDARSKNQALLQHEQSMKVRTTIESEISQSSGQTECTKLDERITSNVDAVVISEFDSINSDEKNHNNIVEKSKEQGLSHIDEEKNDGPSNDITATLFGMENHGLAVATAVGNDEDRFIPAAVEFDPNSKPPLIKNRRFRLYSAMFCMIIISIVTGAIIGVLLRPKDAKNDDLPVLPYRETIGIMEQVAKVVGGDHLKDLDSPYSKALVWITHNDSLQLMPDAKNFIQRYILSYFHFATSIERPWYSCSEPEENHTDDCIFLKLIDNNPILFTEIPSKRWLGNTSECDWAGLYCNENGEISTIDLTGMNMTGSFPEGLKHLTFLQSIILGYGELIGTIPASISDLKHLINLELQGNLLNGTIPDQLWDSRSIQRINLSENRLTGTLSNAIRNANDIKGLYMYENFFTGPIPSALGDLKSLNYLRLQHNFLTGPIPENFGTQEALSQVVISYNNLTGSIPSTFAKMLFALDVRVAGNSFTGELPDSIYNLTDLTRFELFDNNFTGTISTLIGKLSNLELLRIQNNKFSGTIPTELASMPSLLELQLTGNDFVGEMPLAICSLRNNETGALVTLEADCSPSNETFITQITCPLECCTVCCDPSGEDCRIMM